MKRLPNHSGSITKLSGERTKPFLAREGKTGKQRCIGTFKTYEKALEALVAYNREPWDLDNNHVTLQRLWEAFLETKSPQLGQSSLNQLKTAYKRCEDLYNREYASIKAYEMQAVVDAYDKSKSSKAMVKNLFRHLDLFARELDVSTKMYSDLVKVNGGTPRKIKQIFTQEEVDKLWEGADKPFYDTVLFMLYTGFRVSEMFDLKVDNIDMCEMYMRGGCKTDAGRNRIVPIHSKILPIVEENMAKSEDGYLFERNGRQIYYKTYRTRMWMPVMEDLGCQHTPHECRHTFRSWLDSAGAQKTCIDKIMGHSSGHVGEDVYTHKTIYELKKAIEMVQN